MGLSELFDVRAKQQLNRGYSDGMARGVELVLTPLFAGGIGWLLDRWLGTGPFIAIVLGVLGVIGVFVKLKLGYDLQMTEAEAGKPWSRPAATTAALTEHPLEPHPAARPEQAS